MRYYHCQLPEMAHNIMPTIAMSGLVDRVPRKAATYLIYSTQEIDANKALMFGIVSDVVPAAELDSEVEPVHPQGDEAQGDDGQ